MPIFTGTLPKQLQFATKRHAYSDTGTLNQRTASGTYDDYNQPVMTTTSTNVLCAFTDKAAAERWAEIADIETLAGEVRFETPAPAKGDTFTLTKRFGVAVTNETFEIVGIKNRGLMGYVCALKRVTI